MSHEAHATITLPGSLPSDDDQYVTADEEEKGAPARRSRRRRSSVEREAAASGSRSVTPRQEELPPKRSPRNEGTVRGDGISLPGQKGSTSESIASAELSAPAHNALESPPAQGYDAYSSADARNAAKQFRWSDDVGFSLVEVRPRVRPRPRPPALTTPLP